MNSITVKQIADKGGIEAWLVEQKYKNSLRFMTCGSVDDGKSTLIGRLLLDTGHIYKDQLSSLYRDNKRHGTQGKKLDLALLIDGLQAEREQGITIDIAYRYFSTEKCKFIIADTPGHEQYTRNMATAASTSDLAILLIDALKGLLDQTRRHSFISVLLGIKHLVVAVNKMDLIQYRKEIFEKIKKDYCDFATQLSEDLNIKFVPISALEGDNVAISSHNMKWYTGPTLIEILEMTNVNRMNDNQPVRFPVQYVNRQNCKFRGYSGTLISGMLHVGQCLKVLPSRVHTTIARIVTFDGDLQKVSSGEAITLIFKDEIDVSRGDLLVDSKDTTIKVVQSATVDVVWMVEQPLKVGQNYEVKIANRKTRVSIEKIFYQIAINTLQKHITDKISLNGIGLVEISFEEPMALDEYHQNRVTGGMIFIDRISNNTVGAGMINQLQLKGYQNHEYSNFELELNNFICRYFPHWHTRNLLGRN